MATSGQPTSYKPEYNELAHNYCLLGATNEVLGDFVGVTRRTIWNWIATHLDFADAARCGRAVVDAAVVRWLKKAGGQGGDHPGGGETPCPGQDRECGSSGALAG